MPKSRRSAAAVSPFLPLVSKKWIMSQAAKSIRTDMASFTWEVGSLRVAWAAESKDYEALRKLLPTQFNAAAQPDRVDVVGASEPACRRRSHCCCSSAQSAG